MDNRNSGAAGSGITLSGLTFIVFLVLKLCNVINWSWWWVTAPLWMPVTIFVAVCVVVFVVAFIVGAIRYIIKNKRGRD
jgi:uncharacterized membrane protein (DUF485 family)